MSNMKNTLLICFINGVAAAAWAYYECLSTWPAVAILTSTTLIPILIVLKQKVLFENAIGEAFVDGLRYQKELQKSQSKNDMKKSFIAGFDCDCLPHENIETYAEQYIKDMKAILEFNLPEDEIEFQLATKATALQSALWEMKQWLRSQTKYAPDTMHNEAYNAYMICKNKLDEIVYDNDINL